MILVDTAVWIDHLDRHEPRLGEALEADDVACHPMVIEELALGSIKNRHDVLALLGDLRSLPVLLHAEVMRFVTQNRLWGRGLSPVDAHLLGSVRLTPGCTLWTRDRRLREAAEALGMATLQK